ncbi:MAG TPA: histidine kinase [Gemmatimonadaceae bacterium]|jgi:signal transduction histidine kinase/ligand-binding sensor domain-containing protein
MPFRCRSFLSVALLASTLAAGSASAQRGSVEQIALSQMQHRSWTERDGLPGDPLYAPQRSNDGYLWIGTTNGLLRFDGVRFVRFDSTNTPALRTRKFGVLYPLLLDRSGWLWITRPDGMLVRYRDGVFHEVVVVEGGTPPYGLTEDRRGKLWGLAPGLFMLDGDRVVRPTLPAGLQPNDVNGVVPDTGDGVWIGTRHSELWNLTSAGAHQLLPAPNVTRKPPLKLRPLAQTPDGRLWVLDDVVRSYANGQWSMPTIGSPAHGFVGLAAVVSRDGSAIFVTRGEGVIRANGSAAESYSVADGLSDATVEGVAMDGDQSLWMTTHTGLDQLRPALFTTIGAARGLPFDSPRSIIADDDGSLWVSRAGSSQVFHVSGNVVSKTRTPLEVRGVVLSQQSHELLASARGGGIWYYAPDGHVMRYRNGINTVVSAPGMPSSRPTAAYEDSTGGLWLTFFTDEFGVVRNGRYTALTVPGTKARVSRIAPAGRDAVWTAIEGHPGDLFAKYVVDRMVTALDSPGARNMSFGDLVVEGHDTVWAVAGGQFVRVVNGRGSAVEVNDVHRAMYGNSAALNVANGFLWFAGEAGVGRVSVAALNRAADGAGAAPSAEWFGALDGIASAKLTPMNMHAAERGSDGRVWFSTPMGVSVVDPQMIVSNASPDVRIEETVAGGRTLSPSARVEIAPSPERVDVHFTAMNIASAAHTRLQYRLDGVNASWVDATPARVATYTQLSPGSYRFHVRASVAGATFGPEVVTTLRVQPAWYQTWWFRTLVAAFVIAAVSLVARTVMRARSRAHAQRLRERFEVEINERTRMARELHDTLLQGFHGISLELHAVRQTVTRSPQDAESTLARVVEMTDHSLRDARAMVWAMRAPELELLELHAALEAAVRAANAGNVAVAFHVEGRPRELSPGIEMATLRIGKEALTNALAHAQASAVDVVLTYEPGVVRLIVRDDGRGLDADAVASANANGHWGLTGMQERAVQIKAKLDIASIAGRGTTVTLVVPLRSGTRRRRVWDRFESSHSAASDR